MHSLRLGQLLTFVWLLPASLLTGFLWQSFGASTALLRVLESLIGSASGASLLEFLGDPFVEVQTSGASLVRRAGP